MRKFNKLFGLGLPRTGNQTLQDALGVLFRLYEDNQNSTWHSPGNSLHRCMAGEARAAVETFYHPAYLEAQYPDSLFIFNTREHASWFLSCQEVYLRSVDYNHPIWRYSLDYFTAYYLDYVAARMKYAEDHPDRVLVWNLIANPTWGPLCDFLEVDPPPTPFPRSDEHFSRSIVYSPLSLDKDEFGLVGG